MLHDAHNHLQDEWLRPHWEQIAADRATAGIGAMVVNGTCEADWPVVAELARRFPWVRPSYGLHPWDVGNASPGWREALQRQLDADPRAAVGEIGLDRWILERARPDDPRLAGLRRASLAEQDDAFRWQLALAAERGRPASVHCLDAWGALSAALQETPRPAGLLLHAYGGPVELIGPYAKLGAYFSFNGHRLGAPAGSARAERFQTLVRALPEERLLVETDAPAMPLPRERRRFALPVRTDGTEVAHPADLVAAQAALAELQGAEPAALAARLEANFHALFGAD
ncbi:MAG: TatD family hydrolase [Opitutaceae bacterium]